MLWYRISVRYFAFGHSAACLQYRKVTMKAIAFFTKEFCEEAVHEAIDELTNVLCKIVALCGRPTAVEQFSEHLAKR